MYSPYILAYLVSVNLEKETLIRTMATLYFIGSIIIYPMWIFNGLGTFNDLIWSAFLVLNCSICSALIHVVLLCKLIQVPTYFCFDDVIKTLFAVICS